MSKVKRFDMTVKFETKDPSPPEMEEFYDSLSNTLREDKWYFQEYGVSGKNQGYRTIGFKDLTPLQASTIRTKAREYLPKVLISAKKGS